MLLRGGILNKGYSNNVKNLSLFKLPEPEKPTLDQIHVKKLFLQPMVTTQRSVLPDKRIYCIQSHALLSHIINPSSLTQ